MLHILIYVLYLTLDERKSARRSSSDSGEETNILLLLLVYIDYEGLC